MPEKRTIERARRDKRLGKSSSTQAGEFVREEMHHIRKGKHGARSTKQAIAIALNKARRGGVRLHAPRKGQAKVETRRGAIAALRAGRRGRKPSRRRAAATERALNREPRRAATPEALARQARTAARRRGPMARKAAARKAVATKGPVGRKTAARKAAATRQRKAA